MEISYPALTTAALFVALILLDLAKSQYKLLIGHFLFGIIAVLLMIYLSQKGADLVAWGIFSIPLVMLAIGLAIGALHSAPGAVSVAAATSIATTAAAKADGPVPCDASGNPLPPPTVAKTTVTPAAVTKCGSGSGSGSGSNKTQCIDTNKLASA